MRDHAVIGPDRLALDVPTPVQHLERLDHAERREPQLLAEPADLQDRRQVREQDPARAQRLDRVLHDPPRFRQVEDDAIEVALVDALVDVAHLHVERHVVAEEAVTFCDRALREVVADLVARDVPVGPIARSSAVVSAPEPTPDSRIRAPGNMSASMRIGPMSFG